VHVYHWDLDRTYLDTDIHSVRGMVRAAFEHASSKRNIPGAAALLRGLIEKDPTCRVSIISGSPRQMRDVLSEKLALDGVRFDSLVLKDSLHHLRRGRFRAIKGQIGYKLPQLLKTRVGFGKGVRESLFGDDTEVDALVYALYAEAVAGRGREGQHDQNSNCVLVYLRSRRHFLSASGHCSFGFWELRVICNLYRVGFLLISAMRVVA